MLQNGRKIVQNSDNDDRSGPCDEPAVAASRQAAPLPRDEPRPQSGVTPAEPEAASQSPGDAVRLVNGLV
jgi:hypothetical protein